MRIGNDGLHRAILLFLILNFSFQAFSNALIFLNDSKTKISVLYQSNELKLSVYQPIVHPVLPVDWILPKDNRDLLKGLIAVESGFFVHALSSEGAMGLTQLMPETAKEVGVLNPFNVFSAIDGANRYLKQLQRQFTTIERALAAYFEGPTRVAKQGPSNAGINYARRVLRSSEQLKDRTVFIKDVTYIEPYILVGKDFTVGSNIYLSLLGTSYLKAGGQIDFSGKISHHVLFYPNITSSFSLIIGERNLNFTVGVLYRKMPDFGAQFLIDSDSFDFDTLLRVWKFYINAGYSSKGFRIGVMLSM